MAVYKLRWCVRGYHVYKEDWDAEIGDELVCKMETGNVKDPYAVAVIRKKKVVGHLPRKISRITALFLKRKGTVRGEVVGRRRHSADLAQGGVEIPCEITFEGTEAEIVKVRRLLNAYHEGSS